MIFIETDIFTEDCKALLRDDEYRELQQYLTDNPEVGDVITHTGGLRKVRWAAKGKGKRSGVRIIYYHKVAVSHIRLLLIYKKGIKDDLSTDEKKVLRILNERW
ncbi:type II toxin-antitoxin system RelE/ParE family toxin [Candidatus Fukatsuia symbiotica]|uniref:Toxin HigB-2 n=1 Tax=Candidatus Fukatsuia symbiotica TaxID=1878942 RepID=A0A2U8I3K6_9GAMM|nr:type II toxin-antitoxin system RelE/ParE family toxin [Candidatus Fukatsuia symbiotica]AWK13710.1 toxin HigB-2 [Candidatus Fukatsuia symbiotica]MEA9445545.1 type II toxin-antitoxin system RelE/ParE family toxin [Candidatus Fukatsuia symbiotica]